DIKRWSWPIDHGLWDVVDLKEVVSVQAAGYGGGSLVYANVHLRPPAAVFDDRWPVAYRDRKGLDTYFDLAATMLDVKPATSHPDFDSFTKSKTLAEVATRLGRKDQFFYPPLAVTFKDGPNTHGVQQNACTACGRCSTGCPEKAKNTLDHNYLALAERHGAKVVTECEVTCFSELPDGRFRVHCIDHLEGHEATYEAKYLFVCAGSVHSTRLLARAELVKNKDVQQRVGVGFFPGGDALGMIFDTAKPLHPELGPTITTTVVHNEDRDGEGHGRFFLIQDGGYSNELSRLLGTVRAPAWVGRNRLSTAPVRHQDEPPGGDDEFHLPSLLDDILSALQGGELGAKMASSQLRAAWPKLVKELKDPLLLPAIVENTIKASLRKQFKRFWLIGRMNPEKPPASRWIDWFCRLISKGFGGNDTLAEHALNAVLNQGGLKAAEVARQMFGYDASGAAHRTMLLAMGRDAAPGVLQYDKGTDTLVADLDLYHLARGYSNEELLMTDIAKELGGELRTNPAWAFLGKPITVHNQGGCRMTDKSEYGVTDPNGAVHGYDTLFVLDGAALCSSVGVNPSATITAIAERNIAHFLQTHAPERVNDAGRAEYRGQRALAAGFPERARDFQLEPPERPCVPFKSKPLGLRFDESMTGYYSPGTHRPPSDEEFRARERRGRPEYPLRVDLRLSSENLAKFWDDETHALRATGRITLVLPGDKEKRELPLSAGRVELMVPRYKPHGVPPNEHERLVAQEYALLGQAAFERLSATELAELGTPAFPGRRHKTIAGSPPPRAERFLKYWLTFTHDGKYFLVYGYKRVKDDPAFDAWRDTSSLYISLYQTQKDPDLSSVPSSGLLGAGVIHVDMNEFMFKQLPSMFVAEGIDPERRAPGVPSTDDPGAVDPARATWAIAKFGWFFFGSLQRVYAPEFGKVFETFFRLSEGSRPQ
ncbi:MAG TPA: GMC oxidoreductase, partial [Polyangiaceae bacterium]|nr:GMC oxidoreductase [Polyangiaceae bacterium]